MVVVIMANMQQGFLSNNSSATFNVYLVIAFDSAIYQDTCGTEPTTITVVDRPADGVSTKTVTMTIQKRPVLRYK